ncbi:MAG: hypothetical protein HQ537_02035 [Parcubacteria group bacterium]|nr:hypothetical protein [Parcubacteria group bacterium]
MNKDLLQKNIISLLGLESLPEEKKIQLLEKLTDLVFKRTIIKVMELLSEADQEELGKLIDAGDSEKTNAFIAEKVPNFEEIMNKEIISVKEEMAEEVEKIE